MPKEFNGKSGIPDGTGSIGWYVNEKSIFVIDNTPCAVQVQLIITVIGSKEATPE